MRITVFSKQGIPAGLALGLCLVILLSGIRQSHARRAEQYDLTPSAPTPKFTALTAGSHHVCAALTDGEVLCWGNNIMGQLGNGAETEGSTETPSRVIGLSTATGVAAGQDHTCARLINGTVECWGSNRFDQLGIGPKVPSSTEPVPVPGITRARTIKAGSYHTCALLTDGHVRCWGYNESGQLGSGSGTQIAHPVEVSRITQAAGLAAGGSHTCAVTLKGAVLCWGLNQSGELGNGTKVSSSHPVAVVNLDPARSVSAGASHSCAILRNGRVSCWGGNATGQLGDGGSVDSPTPVVVGPVAHAVAVAAGRFHTCALLTGGKVSCWGSNTHGEIGTGPPKGSVKPVVVPGIPLAAAVSAGDGYTCIIQQDGLVKCWGATR
jgi:alpha-tubulin suppressor-like RCC1 family protein